MIHDFAIVGGGIVGLATARALVQRKVGSVVVVEAESTIATHQTGHNSGVIHSGLYYKPGSLKATNCVRGRDALYQYCEEEGIPHERCGKVVVATEEHEIPSLRELERRGKANGLSGLQRLDAEALKDREPHVRGREGLFVEQTGIVDYKEVANAYARNVRDGGGSLQLDYRVAGIDVRESQITLETTQGVVATRHLINCAGLQSDRIARMCGLDPGCQIIPFRGEYYALNDQRASLVRNLIYPVPDPRFPFLGVHFTRMIGGGTEAGPNAVLAFRREGYSKTSFSPRDVWDYATYRGFWRMVGRYWKTGIGEMHRSLSKASFVRALRRLIPELQSEDVVPHGAGVRAQAVGPDGRLIDDFHLIEKRRMVHVLNAPSPAATSSLSIGETIAERILTQDV